MTRDMTSSTHNGGIVAFYHTGITLNQRQLQHQHNNYTGLYMRSGEGSACCGTSQVVFVFKLSLKI